MRLLDAGGLQGQVLDLGCGTGEHALMAAAAGSPPPVSMRAHRHRAGPGKAAQRSLDVRFEVGDALDLSGRGTQFDTVLDCGLFHVFDDDDRAGFVSSLGAAVAPGGRYFMLCFSDKQPGDWGPRRVRRGELRHSFADGWRTDAIDEAVLEITISPEGAQLGWPLSPGCDGPAAPDHSCVALVRWPVAPTMVARPRPRHGGTPYSTDGRRAGWDRRPFSGMMETWVKPETSHVNRSIGWTRCRSLRSRISFRCLV